MNIVNAQNEADAVEVMKREFKGGAYLLDISDNLKAVTTAQRLAHILSEQGLPCSWNRLAPDTVQFHRPEHWNRSVI